MNNKTISTILFTSLALSAIAVIIEVELPNTADTLYLLSGLGYVVFGTWGAFRLRK